ncbi:oxidoreductase [Clostridium zeae]|uniref:Oxidoreductase n=1 Tax=Clostridium zeae TaxID=2759022 RepID=A0ABQ1E8M1_9CLOT|nr:Gfo/Idh/MocA family oxidoreductase [Clostridium zeae]GFZ31026.1 oxidoreductase [Clostridium zeae]
MIRFGVIGTSWITHAFIKGASNVQDFKLSAIYSRDLEKAKEFGKAYEEITYFTSLEEMAQSDIIDAVYIASPNSLHCQQSILFLKNKKHVICEKAFASNSMEVEAMINEAKKNKVVLMEALKSHFFPNFKVIEENIYKLGKIRRYIGNYCQYSSRYDTYKSGIRVNTFDASFSNGSIMDIGIYCIHPMVKLFGLPKQITASAYLLKSGVDGEGSVLAKYEDMDAVIMHSKIAYSYSPSEIQGENGTMIIDKIGSPENIEIIYRNGEREVLTVPQIEDNMFYEAEEFINLINEGKIESKVNSHEHSLNVMKLVDEIRSQTGVKFPADSE